MTDHHREHAPAADPHDGVDTRTPAQHWEDRYGAQHVWSGRVNRTTAEVVTELLERGAAPGRALDLGCGEGADAIRLAEHGFDTTGADISITATERARLAALEAGLPEGRIRFVAVDLGEWAVGDTTAEGLLEGPFDLVTASFFHSEAELARTAILRRAADAIAPGGHLLIVSHLAPPPWSEHARHGGHHDLLDPAGEIAALDLPARTWTTVLAESRRRAATGPDGHDHELDDGVVLLRRS